MTVFFSWPTSGDYSFVDRHDKWDTGVEHEQGLVVSLPSFKPLADTYLVAIDSQVGLVAPSLALLAGAYLAVRGDAVLGQSTGTVYLTAAATVGKGGIIVVKNAGVGTITIDANGAETIDGALTKTVAAGASVVLITNGSNWFTL